MGHSVKLLEKYNYMGKYKKHTDYTNLSWDRYNQTQF